ncbi:hypothetical protein MLDJOKPK_00282 [Salmonella phage SPAsTU]|nr:hypothetical protein MLDJOKPK_00282 [Salmonella phage SPAsTU]
MATISTKQQLCDLYNAANPTLPHPLTVNDFSAGSRSSKTPEGESLANFILNISAKAESQYFTGDISLVYRRLPVGFTGETIDGNHSDWAEDSAVLTQLNADLQRQYPIDELGPDDSGENGSFSISRAEGENAQTLDITITIRNHMKFEDAVIVYSIYEAVVKTDLSTTNGELDGFGVPN